MRSAPYGTMPPGRLPERVARDAGTRDRNDLVDRRPALAHALSERLQLARDLHDGLLQALTGAALQLEATMRIVETDPRAARDRLRDIQDLIVERQSELRRWIDAVRRPHVQQREARRHLAAALHTLCRRASRWGPRVELVAAGVDAVPDELGDHAYRIVEEGLSNVARHARARLASVDVCMSGNAVRIVIADDGRGFPFRGRYDLATLDAFGIGPVSLKERVASLRGGLVLESTDAGSTLRIAIPASNGATAAVAATRACREVES